MKNLLNKCRRFPAESLYLLGNFPVVTVFFCLVITGLSLAVGLFITYFGVIIGAGTLLMSHGFARVQVGWLRRCGIDIRQDNKKLSKKSDSFFP